jgi:hypothetical protein
MNLAYRPCKFDGLAGRLASVVRGRVGPELDRSRMVSRDPGGDQSRLKKVSCIECKA